MYVVNELIATYVDVIRIDFDSHRYIREHWYDKVIFLKKCHKKPGIKKKKRKKKMEVPNRIKFALSHTALKKHDAVSY